MATVLATDTAMMMAATNPVRLNWFAFLIMARTIGRSVWHCRKTGPSPPQVQSHKSHKSKTHSVDLRSSTAKRISPWCVSECFVWCRLVNAAPADSRPFDAFVTISRVRKDEFRIPEIVVSRGSPSQPETAPSHWFRGRFRWQCAGNHHAFRSTIWRSSNRVRCRPGSG